MPKLMLLVEGVGEFKAVPLLLRRILNKNFQRYDFSLPVYNANGKGNLTNEGVLESILNRIRREPDCSALLILLDADEEDMPCPPQLAKKIATVAQKLGLGFPVAVVLQCVNTNRGFWQIWKRLPLNILKISHYDLKEILKQNAVQRVGLAAKCLKTSPIALQLTKRK